MPRRNEAKYDLEFLRSHFKIGQTEAGEWRVFHAHDRGKPSGAGRQIKAGSIADNCISNKGYRICTLPTGVDGKQMRVQAHIVVWVLFNGMNAPSDMDIDHGNRCKLDNDPIRNLRLSSHRNNSINGRGRAKGRLNIETDKRRSKENYVVRMFDPSVGKLRTFGRFSNLEEAKAAADEVIVKIYGEDAMTNAKLLNL